MDKEKFCSNLNRYIFKENKKELLRVIASKEPYFGTFSLLNSKLFLDDCLQHLLQFHEIRMGDALEEIIEEILTSLGFKNLPKSMVNESGETLSLDQYFTDGRICYFIEQKVRDDHDSTKKRGQISNFETKLEILHKKHNTALLGFMYFIDPDLSKNKNYYVEELKRLEKFYGVKLYLFYGKELFGYLNHPGIWDNILSWLKQWKDSLPELPEINFDITPQESFEEIKDLELRTWRKILDNDKLWEEGIIKAVFRDGSTLKLLIAYLKTQWSTPYRELSNGLTERLEKYYQAKSK